MKSLRTAVIGEIIGTFLIVFFGCGCVAAAITTQAQSGVFQVAIVWGLAVAIAIHCTAALSGAHLNPAVTVASWVWQDFDKGRVFPYISAQMLGSFLAAGVVYGMFGGALSVFEATNHITRGLAGSEASAAAFGEFFPNPGGKPLAQTAAIVTLWRAFSIELICTAILVVVIFSLSDLKNSERPQGLAPAYIGLTITLLISLVGPLTMACFNPARDLAPRLFSAMAGWGSIPFSANGSGWLVVYLIGPILGGIVGGGAYRFLLKGRYAK